jgi:CoA:oxalate CoA-transferase
VLDLSRAVAGPFAGRILADLGADVVKAELPGTDVAQSYGKVIRGRSGLYSHVNAGKRSILLDLHEPAGVDRLLDLAAACDVLVENFRPGVLDRFGAGWPVLAAANPRLVMLSISGFGQDGADAGRAAYAPVIHAEAGLIGRQADLTGDPPEDIAFALADTLAGTSTSACSRPCSRPTTTPTTASTSTRSGPRAARSGPRPAARSSSRPTAGTCGAC